MGRKTDGTASRSTGKRKRGAEDGNLSLEELLLEDKLARFLASSEEDDLDEFHWADLEARLADGEADGRPANGRGS